MGTLTVTSVGNAVSTTNNTTLASGATVTASVGDTLLITIAAANAGTSGAAPTVTIADNAGGSTNVYTQRGTTGNYTAGSASDGASQYFFECPVTTALSSNVVTLTFSVNVPQKAFEIYRLQPAASEAVVFSAVGTAQAGAGATSHAADTVSVTTDYTIFGMAAIETDDTITGDSDTTNGSWSTISTRLADGGADAATMSCSTQYKTVTGTGNQSWACTTATGRDSARNYIIYRSTAAVSVNANPTGVEGTGAVGTVTVEADASTSVTGVNSTGAVGTVVVPNEFVSVSGVAGTGSVGTVVVPNEYVSLSGVEGTGSVGTTTQAADANVSVTGVSGTGELGTDYQSGPVNHLIMSFQGWSSGAWGEAGWGEEDPAFAGATGSVGDVTVSTSSNAGVNVDVTGVEGTGAVGTITVTAAATVSATGVSGTGELGTPSVECDANTTLTGVEGTGELGTPSVYAEADVSVTLTGVEGTGAVGDVTVSFATLIYPDGVEAAGAVGDITVEADASVEVTGVFGTTALGDVIISIDQSVSVDGVSGSAEVGSVSVDLGITVHLDGLVAVGSVGGVLIWSLIDDGQVPGWGPVTDSQTPGWTPIANPPATSWTEIPEGTSNWQPVQDDQTTIWTQVAV